MGAVLHQLATLPSLGMTQGSSPFTSGGMGRLSQNTVTASFFDIPFKKGGVVSNLWVRVVSNGVSATSTISSRVNGSAGNQSVPVTSGSTGDFTDSSNTDTLADGDTFSSQTTVGAGGTTFNPSLYSYKFAASADTVALLSNTANISGGAASTTYYFSLTGGFSSLITTEANVQTKMKHAGTLSHWYFWVQTNGRTTDTIYRSRINGSNGNLLVTVTGSSTGGFSDTSNSDTYAVDDLVCISGTTGTGSGNVIAGQQIHNTTTDRTMTLAAGVSSLVINASVTAYFSSTGHLANVATEINTRGEIAFDATASKLEIYISANTVSATSNLRLRKNGANGNQNVSITASTSGWFDDPSNSDSLTAGDEFNYQLITGGSGTSLTVQMVAMLMTTPAPVTDIPYQPNYQRAPILAH